MTEARETIEHALEVLSEPPPTEQLSDPLDYLFADHFRQRILCNVIDDMADRHLRAPELVATVKRFLEKDLRFHVQDEEQDLFPLLEQRSEPDDHIEDVLDQLRQEHAADEVDAIHIIEHIEDNLAATGKVAIRGKKANLLHRFADNERRHLTLENAIVLPLARSRLTARDLLQMGKNMARRRGVKFPEKTT